MSISTDLKDDELSIGKLIRKKRKEKGYTQQTLADELNVSPQAVSKWEMGTSVPSPENRRALSEILGTDLQVERETAPPVPLRRWKRLTLAAGLLCLALLAALLLPGLYVAMATYHQEMIPTKLLLAIIDSKQEVPFDTVFEVIGLLAAFELLQEAGLHLPQAIGTAVSIIGGLAVGTTAVDARLISPAALIVAASAGICGFTLPSRDLSDAIRVWRFALAILAGVGGLFALTAGGVLLLIHLSGLTSLDVSYLSLIHISEPTRPY